MYMYLPSIKEYYDPGATEFRVDSCMGTFKKNERDTKADQRL